VKHTLTFESSRQAVVQIERAHDFFGGALVALRNLGWQVKGFTDAYPDLNQKEVVARFAAGFESGGTNALTLVRSQSWEDQEQLLCQLRLINAIATYEAWCESIVAETGSDPQHAVNLQFPEKIGAAISGMGGGQCDLLQTARLGMDKRKLHYPAGIPHLLVCYRAFKEVRNSLAHGGGHANSVAVTRSLNYETQSATWSSVLPARSRPALARVSVGLPVTLTTRGVVGFVAVLQMLIASIDGELTGTNHFFEMAVRRWSDLPQARGDIRNVGLSSDGALSKFGSRWAKASLPALGKGTRAMLDEFADRGLV
jgi:hypothetical protein